MDITNATQMWPSFSQDNHRRSYCVSSTQVLTRKETPLPPLSLTSLNRSIKPSCNSLTPQSSRCIVTSASCSLPFNSLSSLLDTTTGGILDGPSTSTTRSLAASNSSLE